MSIFGGISGGGGGGGPAFQNTTGDWDASTNTPDLTALSPVDGQTYYVAVGGTQDLGSGDITFEAGDYVRWSDTASAWSRLEGPVSVTEVVDGKSLLGGSDLKTSLDRLIGGSLELNGNNKAVVQTNANFITGSIIDDSDMTDNTGSPTFLAQLQAMFGADYPNLGVNANIDSTGTQISGGNGVIDLDTTAGGITLLAGEYFLAVDSPGAASSNYIDIDSGDIFFTEIFNDGTWSVGRAVVAVDTPTATSIVLASGNGRKYRLGYNVNPITEGQLRLSTSVTNSLALADSAQQPPSEGAFVDGDKTKLDNLGLVVCTLALSSGGNVNVTDATGYNANAKTLLVRLTGTISADSTVTMPAVGAGGRLITIKDAGGNGLTSLDVKLEIIPAGSDTIDNNDATAKNAYELTFDYQAQQFYEHQSGTKWEAV